jgi:hypothetical protein
MLTDAFAFLAFVACWVLALSFALQADLLLAVGP